ncbi:hypothetical protein CLAIMM_00463 [Cladophialophora immunda]|nr:hypothetical protein CLAIMM_00463 [Cladophialophora immunda]
MEMRLSEQINVSPLTYVETTAPTDLSCYGRSQCSSGQCLTLPRKEHDLPHGVSISCMPVHPYLIEYGQQSSGQAQTGETATSLS